MPMTVLNVAYSLAAVGADTVGGAEQILSALDRGLVRAGERSVVVASAGSHTAGRLVAAAPQPDSSTIGGAERLWARRQMQVAIDRALAEERIDLIHLHGLDFDQYTLPPGIPVLVTLHMPVSWYPAGVLERAAGRMHLCCVSQSQRRSCPLAFGPVHVVENGVALPEVVPDPALAPAFALVLGRICPEKNQHEALEAGTRAGVPVLVGGQVFPYREHQEYFEHSCRPLFAQGPHRFLGPLGPADKRQLLAGARCLLHPTRAPETSSLVAMEALAAGTPVIAYRSGALPEIVEDGVTGFLVDDVDEMATALARAGELSRATCRETAERRFSEERMLAGYFALYRKLLRRPAVARRARYA